MYVAMCPFLCCANHDFNCWKNFIKLLIYGSDSWLAIHTIIRALNIQYCHVSYLDIFHGKRKDVYYTLTLMDHHLSTQLIPISSVPRNLPFISIYNYNHSYWNRLNFCIVSYAYKCKVAQFFFKSKSILSYI